MFSGRLSTKSETVSDTDSGGANANAARRAKCFECESRTATLARADVCTVKPQRKTSLSQNDTKTDKGSSAMLNELLAIGCTVIAGIMAAGAIEANIWK